MIFAQLLKRKWRRHELDDGTQFGYRYIWRTPDGALQAARGQARIPNIAAGKTLMDKAVAEAWGNRDGDAIEAAAKRLVRHGYVVNLATGYVGRPDKNAAVQDNPLEESINDSLIINDWS